LVEKKTTVALLSIFSNTALVVLKLVVGLLTNSVSVLAEALHSGLDLIAAAIAYFSVRVADLPADDGHPYGHGKVENFSGLIEALLISVAAILIVNESVDKMINGVGMRRLEWGVLVMGISVVLNIVVSIMLFRTAKKTDSIALQADAEHLRTDVFTSLGVFVGLGLIKFTGYEILDPLVAMGVAGLIFFISTRLIRQSATPLLDTNLPQKERETIEQLLKHCDPRIVGWHRLRTRKSGSWRFVDLHIHVESDITVGEAHELCRELEECIRKELPRTQVLVHVEPKEDAAPNELRPPEEIANARNSKKNNLH